MDDCYVAALAEQYSLMFFSLMQCLSCLTLIR